jgi:hypothetical protein
MKPGACKLLKPGACKLWKPGVFKRWGNSTQLVQSHRGFGFVAHGDGRDQRRIQTARDVALQVAFERQTLKPGFSLDRL